MNIKQRRLPSAYQEVEWIQSDSYSYFILPFSPTADDSYKIETENQYVDYTGGWPDLIIEGNASASYWFGVRIGAGTYTIGGGTSTSVQGSTSSFDKIIAIKENHTLSLSVNNINLFSRTSYDDPYGNVTGVFCAPTNNPAYMGNYRKKYFRMEINGTSVCNLIPCYRISDSVIGMYDTVGGTFYTNQGSGTFTKGADVVTVDSISVTEGDVLRINDGNGNLLWKKHFFDFKELWDALVSFHNATGADENGRFVYSSGSLNDRKIIKNSGFKANTAYKFYAKGYNSTYEGQANLNIKFSDSTYQYINFMTMNGGEYTTPSSKTISSFEGLWYGGTPKIYDFYIDEIG